MDDNIVGIITGIQMVEDFSFTPTREKKKVTAFNIASHASIFQGLQAKPK